MAHKSLIIFCLLFILPFLNACEYQGGGLPPLPVVPEQIGTYSSVKQPGGLFFSINGDDKYIGGLEVFNSSSTYLFVYNITRSYMERIEVIKGSTSIWSFCESEGNIYIGSINKGQLIRYGTESGNLEYLYDFEEESIYDIVKNDQGDTLYIGTQGDSAGLYAYAISTGIMSSLGMVSEQNFTRSLSYVDGYCYAGIGSQAELIQFDLVTGEAHNILPSEYSEDSFVYNQVVVDERIVFILSPSHKVVSYDTITGVFCELSEDARTMEITEETGAFLHIVQMAI